MVSRRLFLKGGLLMMVGLALPTQLAQGEEPAQKPVLDGEKGRMRAPAAVLATAHPSLNPAGVPKYVTDLILPPPMPMTRVVTDADGKEVDFYEIAVRQFEQQILPPAFHKTPVWSYGPAGSPWSSNDNFNYPAFSIEATAGRPVRVRWVNQLIQKVSRALPDSPPETIDSYLPHLLPVDQTLHWAYPQGGPGNTDLTPVFSAAPGTYIGPVPMIPHVHGAHSTEESDGYPTAWWLPDAADIPPGYAIYGKDYLDHKALFEGKHGVGPKDNWEWRPGSAVFQYNNDQRAGTIWYHDHTMGMTRTNVYAGPAGFYLIRGDAQHDGSPLQGTLPGPAPQLHDSPFAAGRYEIPIAIQDRSFNLDGSLFYPDSRAFFDEFNGPYTPTAGSDISPIWNPEFFGEMIVVNGRTWPVLHVEPRRYRFRFLNGCQARTLILKLAKDPLAQRPVARETGVPPFWVIATEGGFLPDKPISLDNMLAMPAERFDVIIDFGKAKEDGLNELFLINEGPDEPYKGGVPTPADPEIAGQVMKFVIDVALAGSDSSTDPSVQGALVLPPLVDHFPGQGVNVTRQLSLNELESKVIFIPDPLDPQQLIPVGPKEALLGTVIFQNNIPMPMPMEYMEPVSEVIKLNDVEVWEIFNFTADAHPIHIHEIMGELVNRQDFDAMTGVMGAISQPDPWEAGWKDTFIALPGSVTRIRMRFDIPGHFVWHCHIVEHEDNEMMRPLQVVYPYYFPIAGG